MIKIIQLNTNLIPFFTGTYESIWEVREYDDHNNKLTVSYESKYLCQSIVRAYKGHEDLIVSELQLPFIQSIQILDTFFSPREYNFSTDVLDFNITISTCFLARSIYELRNNKDFEKFLHDNYTSYDGFMSFTPNNYQQLYENIINTGNEYDQSLGALIQFLALQNNENIFSYNYDSIEMKIYEDWNGNGYMGLDYETQCSYCYTPVSYENDYKCKNKECEKYENTLINSKLKHLRRLIKAECMSYGDILELQSLAKYIDKNDVALLEWARVPENEEINL